MLGSGAFAPPPPGKGEVRNPAGHAVRLGGRIILLDFGFGNLRQMVRAGLDPRDVSHVFLTHLHLDHLGDLAALLFMFRYDAKPKSGTLNVYGPPGFLKFWNGLQRLHAPWVSPRGYRAVARELESGARVAGEGWTLRAQRTPHSAYNLAYRLEAKGRSLVYSGDTGPGEDLPRFAAGCDLFLLECAQPENDPLPGHMTPRRALAAVEASGCRKALITHVSEASARELKRLIKTPKVRVARDLMRVRVPF